MPLATAESDAVAPAATLAGPEMLTGICWPSNTEIWIGALSVTWSGAFTSSPPRHGRSYFIDVPRSVTTGLSVGSWKSLLWAARSCALSAELAPDSGPPFD